MTKKQLNLALVIIIVGALLAAFGLTGLSRQISQNKAESRARAQVLGTWTEVDNPQNIIQFTDDGQYKVMGQTVAKYSVDPDNSIITLRYDAGNGSRSEYYSYAFDAEHAQMTVQNVDTGQVVLYRR